MPERRFDDGYWDDPFVQSAPKDAKLLYAYLWTNKHCNPAGLYQITPKTISFETGIAEADIPELFGVLKPKVVWYSEQNLVWVKNFIKRQSISSKFLVAVARCLSSINNNGAVKELLDYNLAKYRVSIPYEYGSDRVSIPSTSTSYTNSLSSSNNRGEGVVKGEGELNPLEEAVIERFARLPGWKPADDDITWLRDFRTEFPEFDATMVKACVDYNSGRSPPKHKGIWKNRFRNWMIKEKEIRTKDNGSQRTQVQPQRRRPLTYIRGSEPVGPEE